MDSVNIDLRLSRLFEEWSKRLKCNGDKNFTKDGILYKDGVSIEQTLKDWESSKIRVLFLLKDQNQGQSNWDEDIRYWLKNSEWDNEGALYNKEANRNLRPKSIRILAYILWGLSKGSSECGWEYEEVSQHFDEVKEFFNSQPFAIVECKKQPGLAWCTNKLLQYHLNTYGDLLAHEIEILRPNIIVCSSTLIYGFVLNIFPTNELEGEKSLYWHSKSGTIIICAYHPAARKSQHEIYDSVMTHYRNFLKKH
ncbi:MAG: uracil-DNA glycosylase family protein [Muribaculaceae bacterium]|nr:uracil-DNA glycosylase family protein [Muribaculaceae bacterium]